MTMPWRRFALIDAAQDAPTLHDEIIQQSQAVGVLARSLFEGQPEAELAAYAPWLLEVPLDDATRDLTAWLNHRHQHGPAVAWLAAETDFAGLYAHLQQQIDVQVPDGSLAMLRFWDARVFARLHHILALDQQIALMGPVLEWQIALEGKTFHVSRTSLVELIQRQEAEAEAARADADA